MVKQITKSYLEYLGITEVSEDGQVYTKRGPISPGDNGKGYKFMTFSGAKEDTNRHNIYIHNIVYAWFKGEIPYGKEIHHIDKDKTNNHILNLVALTPEEHKKEHESTRMEKCRLDIPREWYVNKLKESEALNTRYGASAASKYRAKLRYYDANIEEAQKKTEYKKDLMELAYWKKEFKTINKRLWKECCIIDKTVKAKGQEAWPMVKHALEVIHTHYERK